MKIIAKELLMMMGLAAVFAPVHGAMAADLPGAGAEQNCDSEELGSTTSATYKAIFQAISYNISYNLNGGTHGASHPASAAYDSTFTVNNPTNTNATSFAGWAITGMDDDTHTYGTQTTTATSIASTTATSFKNLRSTAGTVTFTAKWNCKTGYNGDSCSTLNTYTITVNKNGGSGTLTAGGKTATGNTNLTFTCTHGDTVTLPAWGTNNALAKAGSVFTGWSESSFTCTGAKTITAQYGTCTGVAGNNVASVTYANNTNNKCSYSYTCKSGWHIGTNAATTTGSFSASSAGNVTAAANTSPACNANEVQLSYVDGVSGAAINTTPTSCTYGTEFNLPVAPTKTGYTFTGWELQ